MAKQAWRMDSGPGTTRGACVNCKDDATKNELLVSVCVNGTSQCYCNPCSNLPKIRKYKQGEQ